MVGLGYRPAVRKSCFAVALLLSAFYLSGCAGRNALDTSTAAEHFTSGEELFAKEKWERAAEDFKWIVFNYPASDLAAEAQYLYAECAYQRRQYVEAQLEYERYLRRWTATDRLVQARYRIVECLVAQSPKYFYSQFATEDALVEIQDFIDEFPGTPQSIEAEEMTAKLRGKLAQKLYEAGRQYLKWRQSESARLYFGRVLDAFYDTPYANLARLGMVVSYIVAEDIQGAQDYLNAEVSNFSDTELHKKAESFIVSASQEKFDLAYYLNLYR